MIDEYNFTVGMQVVFDNRYRRELCEIEKITPTGLIKLKGERWKAYTFKPSGYSRGADKWDTANIKPATPEIIAEFKRKYYIEEISDMITENSAPTDLLAEIYEKLKKATA